MHDDFLMFGSEFGPRLFGVNSLVFGHGFEHSHEVHGVGAAPRGERTLSHTQIWVGHHQIGVNFVGRAETEAFLARTVRRVEGEVTWGQLFVRRSAFRAHQLLAEVQHFADGIGFTHDFDGGDAIGQAQSRFHAVGQAPVNTVFAHQAIHNHIDGVLFIAGQFLACFLKLRDFHHDPVNASPREPLAKQINEQRVVFTLATANYGCQHLKPSSVFELHYLVNNLLGGLFGQSLAIIYTVLDTDTGKQQTQVVVHLGDRAHRGTRITRSRFLIYRNSRRKAFDDIDVGFVHLPEELPRIGAEAFYIAPLTLGINRVERQTALATARQTREHNQTVTG